MRNALRVVLAFFVSAVFSLSSFAGDELPDILNVTAELSPLDVRPLPGATHALGFARLAVGSENAGFTYAMYVQSLSSVTGIHVHRGGNGVVGEVVLDLSNATFDSHGAAAGAGPAPLDVVREIRRNPGGFYFDVHTRDNPGGEMRGQFRAAAVTGLHPVGPMTGANERPAAGDPDALAFALFEIDEPFLHYTIVARNLEGPTSAHVHYGKATDDGAEVIDLQPVFVNGVATGTVTADYLLLSEIRTFSGDFYVDIHSTAFPQGAVRAQVQEQTALNQLVFPAAGRTAGANDTYFRTDVSIFNPVDQPVPVTVSYYASGESGLTAPTVSRTLILDPHEQRNFTGDQLQQQLGLPDGVGALSIESPRAITATARAYNDQRAGGKGTFSQFVQPQRPNEILSSGVLPMLANQQGASGYRTNVGWFNRTATAASVTFRVHRPNGTVLHAVTRNVPAKQQLQMGLSQLFPTLEPLDALYVTFDATAPIPVYASIVDNTNGDAIYIPAQQR